MGEGCWQGRPRLAEPGSGTRGQTRPVGNLQRGISFFLAATGDVEEDGGLSDSVQTSKMIPVVCLWSSLPPPVPPTLTSLSESAGQLSGGPKRHLSGASGQSCVPMAKARGWEGSRSYQVGTLGLLGPMQGPWGLGSFAAVCSKRNRQRESSEGLRGQDGPLLQP